MEACGSAHHWGRAIGDLGHEVRLIPPVYVKPFVKRQKNDAIDAEAIAEAASRPTMRCVAVKSEGQQARAMLFRTRDLLVRQRTQLINALRGHLSEHGVVAAQGPANVKVPEEAIEDQTTSLPLLVVELARVFLDQIDGLSKNISKLEKVTAQEATCGETTRRLRGGFHNYRRLSSPDLHPRRAAAHVWHIRQGQPHWISGSSISSPRSSRPASTLAAADAVTRPRRQSEYWPPCGAFCARARHGAA